MTYFSWPKPKKNYAKILKTVELFGKENAIKFNLNKFELMVLNSTIIMSSADQKEVSWQEILTLDGLK